MRTTSVPFKAAAALLAVLAAALIIIFPNTGTAEERHSYLVLFNGTVSEQLIEETGGEIKKSFPVFDMALASLTPEQASALVTHEDVEAVEHDHEITISSHWTNWGSDHINIQVPRSLGLTGDGVRVAVLDTGVSAVHPDLHVTAGYNFVNDSTSYDDDNGHGTHVAGVIAAGQSEEGLLGVAPGVELYAGKIMDHRGQGFHSNMVRGIEWAMENDVDIINLSVGGERHSESLQRAVKTAEEAGILLVGAAGNRGDRTGYASTVDYPAKYNGVIAVAAVDADNQRLDFSGYGPEVLVAAPGVNINSTHTGTSYEGKTGTSMAAPYVTGMLAVMKEANPGRGTEFLKEKLISWTVSLGNTVPNDQTGYGVIRFPDDMAVRGLPPVPVEDVHADVSFISENEARISVTWEDSDREEDVTYRLKRNNTLIYEGTNTSFEDRLTDDRDVRYTVIVDTADGDFSEPVRSRVLTIRLENPYVSVLSRFSDVNINAWYVRYVGNLVDRGLISGYGNDTLRPERAITRAEAAVILSRYQGWGAPRQDTRFTDVSASHYASGIIAEAERRGILYGYSDGTFRPDAPVTRGDLAVLFNRIFTYRAVENVPAFRDVDSGRYYASSVRVLADAGIVQGYPGDVFRPQNPVTRAEYSAFLVRSINHTN